MYHNILKSIFTVWICLLLLQVSISAQQLSQNGEVTINVDNCCSGQYNEWAGGQVQDYTIPSSPSYNGITFNLRGGDGGKAKAGANCESEGGDGATVSATFVIGTEAGQLQPGGTIRFIVGKHGDDDSVGGSNFTAGSGGGGTAVLYRATSSSNWLILAVAGGGGGAFQGNVLGGCVDSQKGQGGRASENGGGGAGSNAGSGGTNGEGGGKGEGGQLQESGGGGGAYSGGGYGTLSDGGAKGYSGGGSGGLVNGNGTEGNGGYGFGGGGSAYDAPGGGGGYSGGGGGGKFNNGGGGGSYVHPTLSLVSNKTDGGASGGTDHGYVTYEFKNVCAAKIDWIEEVSGFCGTSSTAQIKVHIVNSTGCSGLTYYLISPFGAQASTTGDFTVSIPNITYTVGLYFTVDGVGGFIDGEAITITAPDTRPPYMKCKNTSVGISGSSRLIANFENRLDDGSTDNCELVSLSPSNNYFTCSSIGQQIITLTGTDATGNTATCTSTVTVFDSGGPTPDVANLPTLTDACSVTVTTTPTATDGCDAGTFTATTNSPLTYTEPGTYNIVWTYEDNNGNTSTQNQTVIIDDQSAPVATCPDDITVDVSGNSCNTTVNYIGSVVDNCESLVDAVTYTGNSSNVPAGTDRLLLVQVCHFGDVSSMTYNGEEMSLAVKQYANITGTCEVWYLPLGTGGAINTNAQISGTGFPNSVKYITFEHVNQNEPFGDIAQGQHVSALNVSTRLKDMIYEGFMRRDGNSITPRSSQTEIFDNSFNISGSRCWGAYKAASGGVEEVKINTNNGAHVALVLQANHTTQFSYSIDPGSTFPIGTTPVTFTATDKGNNSSSCIFNVNVYDTTPPSITCPDDISVNTATGLCTAVVDYTVSSSDDCSDESIELTNGLASGSAFPVGVTTNTLVVTDAGGLTASCSFQVTVNDIELPVATCENITVQLDTDGNASIENSDIDDGSTDNCTPLASLTLDQTDFNCTDVGSNTVILTAIDNANNSSTCQATVLVEDNVPPTALCQNQTVQLDNTGNVSILPEDIDNGSNDACGIASMSLNTTSFICANVGANQVVLTVMDNYGNSSTCEATVTVEDNVAPIAICQDKTIQLDANGNASTSTNEIDNGSNDACGLNDLVLSKTSFNCADVGTQSIILTATDNNDNSNTCQAIVTVQDLVFPTANCNNLTINLPDRNIYNLSPAEIDAIALGSSDNCNWTPTITSGPTSYDCDDRELDFTVTLTITDVANNTSSCQAIISIRDPNSICNDPPVAVCQDITVAVDGNCEVTITADQIDNGSSDPDFDELTYSLDSEGPFGPGTSDVILTVADAEYNSTCSATVTVIDDTDPVAVCNNPTITFNGESSINLGITDIWNENASSDNCGDITFFGQDISSVSCDQIGQTIPVLVTIEDNYGNEATCSANAMVSGLPCDWMVDPSGVGCNPGQASYNTGNGTFTLTSETCYDPSYYRQNDGHGFIQRNLCGDGEIIAQVTGVNGNGWAGISMRESGDPSAPMIQLMIDGVSISRRELRQAYGNYAFAHLYPTNGKNWLRLSRSSNQFTASHSADGVNWEHVFITQIPMSNCIEIGLITMNGGPSGEISGTFDNLSISGVSALSVPSSPAAAVDIAQMESIGFSLFPNPAIEMVNLQFGHFDNKPIQARIYNHLGQMVKQFQWEEADFSTQRIDINDLQAGTYMVEVSSGGERVSKKLVVARM